MLLTDILTADRILVDVDGATASGRDAVLTELGSMLTSRTGVSAEQIERQLREREALQSTGIGDGVAIPHTSLARVAGQCAALILVPGGVEFDAIDGQPVQIVFGVVGPKSAASEHLKILAKVSRLLKSPETRRRLLESGTPEQAYSLIEEHESSSSR